MMQGALDRIDGGGADGIGDALGQAERGEILGHGDADRARGARRDRGDALLAARHVALAGDEEKWDEKNPQATHDDLPPTAPPRANGRCRGPAHRPKRAAPGRGSAPASCPLTRRVTPLYPRGVLQFLELHSDIACL